MAVEFVGIRDWLKSAFATPGPLSAEDAEEARVERERAAAEEARAAGGDGGYTSTPAPDAALQQLGDKRPGTWDEAEVELRRDLQKMPPSQIKETVTADGKPGLIARLAQVAAGQEFAYWLYDPKNGGSVRRYTVSVADGKVTQKSESASYPVSGSDWVSLVNTKDPEELAVALELLGLTGDSAADWVKTVPVKDRKTALKELATEKKKSARQELADKKVKELAEANEKELADKAGPAASKVIAKLTARLRDLGLSDEDIKKLRDDGVIPSPADLKASLESEFKDKDAAFALKSGTLDDWAERYIAENENMQSTLKHGAAQVEINQNINARLAQLDEKEIEYESEELRTELHKRLDPLRAGLVGKSKEEMQAALDADASANALVASYKGKKKKERLKATLAEVNTAMKDAADKIAQKFDALKQELDAPVEGIEAKASDQLTAIKASSGASRKEIVDKGIQVAANKWHKDLAESASLSPSPKRNRIAGPKGTMPSSSGTSSSIDGTSRRLASTDKGSTSSRTSEDWMSDRSLGGRRWI